MAKLIALYRSQFGSFDSHGLIASWQNCLNSGILSADGCTNEPGKGKRRRIRTEYLGAHHGPFWHDAICFRRQKLSAVKIDCVSRRRT